MKADFDRSPVCHMSFEGVYLYHKLCYEPSD